MSVLDDEQCRFGASQRRGVHQSGQPASTRIRVDLRQRHIGVGDAEQIVEQQQGLIISTGGSHRSRARAGGVIVDISHAEASAQQLGHDVERDVTGVGFAHRPIHLDAATGGVRGGLAGRSALADTRRSHHIHDSAATADRAVHHRIEGRHLPCRAPPDSCRPAGRGHRADRSPAVGKPHGFVGSLDAHQLWFAQHDFVLDQPRGRLSRASRLPGAQPTPSAGRSRLSRRGPVAQPSRADSPAITRPEFRPTRTAESRHRGALPRPRTAASFWMASAVRHAAKSMILQRDSVHRRPPSAVAVVLTRSRRSVQPPPPSFSSSSVITSRSRSRSSAAARSIECTTSANSTVTCLYFALDPNPQSGCRTRGRTWHSHAGQCRRMRTPRGRLSFCLDHRVCPVDVPFVSKGFRHFAIAVQEVVASDFVPVGPGQQRA